MHTRAATSPLVLDRLQAIQLQRPMRLRLLGGADCEHLIVPMQAAGHEVTFQRFSQLSTAALCALAGSQDILIVDISTSPKKILVQLDALITAIGIGNIRPRVLCFSTVQRNPDFISQIHKCGARYVRIFDSAMLLEAIDLVLWEMNELEHNGPRFRITHKYSQGICAPGEEAAAIELLERGDPFHLPLALTERLVFEVLAHHQRLSLDSSQIVSAISAEWFFRDHAANSGRRQVKKLRRPTVKVSVQRIRDALAFVFQKAGLPFDPYDVLRSCPAAGTNRALYKLHGQVEWHHPLDRR